MKIPSLYDTLVQLEKSDFVAVKGKRLYIRSQGNLYVSLDKILSVSKAPGQVTVNSIGQYSTHKQYLPANLHWTN